ncbi:MAG: TetR/AcrR family transcriptional regulator [Streptosporangiaceae bacterium]
MRKILDAALGILVRDGLPGLNTNRVAEEAGVNVSTVYAYFPDKLSIVSHLAEEFERKRGDYLAEHAKLLATTGDWRGWYEEVIDRLAQFRTEEPGGIALRRAVMSSPELRHLDDESTDRAVESSVPGLLAHGAGLDREHVRGIAKTVALTMTVMLDSAFATDHYDRQMIVELKRMTNSYLATYLD